VRVADHTVVGFVFVGLAVVHLTQRRRTIACVVTQFALAQTFLERRTDLALSDVLLFLITPNVLMPGILDWGLGQPIQLPLPVPFDRWHLDSGLALVVFLALRVWQRRKRFRRSTIR
jgi:hypothetical protein